MAKNHRLPLRATVAPLATVAALVMVAAAATTADAGSVDAAGRRPVRTDRLAAAAPAITPPCAATGPEYYAFPLVTTKNVPGTGLATGTAEVAFSASSPFAVSLAADGSYRYDLSIRLERAKAPARGTLVAWVTTPDLSEVVRVGPLDANLRAGGRVAWNKFLVVVSLEAADDPAAARWSGPVAFRGMSRSGMMHTMVGHGVFQKENCAAYGY